MLKKPQPNVDEFSKFYDKALKFLSYRPRSEKEVRDNLKKSSFAKASEGQGKKVDELISLVINKLKEQKFLNDKDFTKWWIEQRTLVKPTGKRLIKFELKKKGIDKELIDEIFDSVEDLVHDELEMARNLVQRKINKYLPAGRQVKALDRQKIYQRLGGFLSRRGFDYDTIKKSIDEFISKEG